MLKKIRLRNQIILFAMGFSAALLLLFIFPMYYIFEKIVFQQVTENSAMTLGQMNSLGGQVFSKLENLGLSIAVDSQIKGALSDLKQQKGTNQISAVNRITEQLIFYRSVWSEISEVTVFSEAMELEPYLLSWDYRYVRGMESEDYQKLADKISGSSAGFLLMGDDIIFYRPMDAFGEESDILCIKIAGHVLGDLFVQQYANDGAYYMVNEAGEIAAGSQKQDYFEDLSTKEPDWLTSLPEEKGTMVKDLQDGKYVVSYSNLNRFGIRMIEFIAYQNLMQTLPGLLVKMTFIGIIILCLAIPLIICFGNRFVQPIVHLSEEMKKVGLGDFKVTVQEEYTNEIGQMNRHFIWMIEKIKALIQNIERVSQQRNIAELEVLQQQINPHFLYNVLDSMYWMSVRARQENISQVIIQLGNFFRLSLSKGKSIISLREELDRLQNYVALQKLCINKKIHYTEDIEPELYDAKIIRLILQPFVENSIMHGYPEAAEEYEISVSGWSDGGDLYIQVSDEGVGVSTEQMAAYLERGPSEDRGSYGIYNVNQRIKLYYGEKYGIQYLPVRKGTTVLIHLSQKLEDGYVSIDDC